jgi:cytochrome P450
MYGAALLGRTDHHAQYVCTRHTTYNYFYTCLLVAAPSFPFARPHGTEPPKEYAELRSKCPVARAKLFDGSNIWLITKHKDLKQVLTDGRFTKVRDKDLLW